MPLTASAGVCWCLRESGLSAANASPQLCKLWAQAAVPLQIWRQELGSLAPSAIHYQPPNWDVWVSPNTLQHCRGWPYAGNDEVLVQCVRRDNSSPILLDGCEGHLHLFYILRLPASKRCLLPFCLLIIIPWGVWTDCFSLRAMQRNSLSTGKLWLWGSDRLPQMISCNIQH